MSIPPETRTTSPGATPFGNDSQALASALHFVAELGQMAASATELRPVLDWMVERSTAMFDAEECCLRVEHGNLAAPGIAMPAASRDVPVAEDFHTVIRVRHRSTTLGSWERSIARSVALYLSEGHNVIATPDLLDDPAFPLLRGTASRVRAMLAVPLEIEGRIIGVLAVTHSTPGRVWTESEIDLIRVMAQESAAVFERIWGRLMSEQLRLAHTTQMSMVPARPLRAGGWEVAGRVAPALPVGGDAFDYSMCGGRIALAISDVSGKGLPAAMLMASLQGSLRAVCGLDLPVPDKIGLLNEYVVRSVDPGRFVTMFYGELALDTRSLRYTNAGHNYPLLRRADGRIETLEEGGFPLGLFEGSTYAVGEVAVAPGDSLLLYSDGVTDAVNPHADIYGEARLRDLWHRMGAQAAKTCVDRLAQELSGFRGGAVQADDETLVVLGPAED
jgi:sigma-B regulation protein RsbU (phosphoserine phosphatase)